MKFGEFFLSGNHAIFVIVRGNLGSVAEMFCGFKNRHISDELGDGIMGGGLGNIRDAGGHLDQIVIGFGKCCDVISLALGFFADIHTNKVMVNDM